MSRTFGVVVVLALLATAAFAGPRPTQERVWEIAPPPIVTPAGTVPYNTIFLNRCASGCIVRTGNTDSRTDHSSIGQGTVAAFMYGDASWQNVVKCVKDTFSPFGVNVTDVDPGTANHFEIMIAGIPQNIGLGGGVGGISPFNCNTYIDNSLVFDFANVWQGNIEEICSTAAQEIAHSFALDHVIIASDPMTYFPFTGRRYFTSSAQCGSDCVNGRAPFGNVTCTGANAQSHPCSCTNQNIQNSIGTLTTLFGAGNPPPPVVMITKPRNGDAVAPGFAVVATATADSGITKTELRVDGVLVLTLTSSPYAFNAPAMLADGTHHVEVTAYDGHGVSSKSMIDAIIGPPCTKPSECPNTTQTCVGGRCVPGPGTQGGLGEPCTKGTDCASGQCSSDGTNSYCVEPCDLGMGQCPPSFGCLDAGGMHGICWPGYDDGTHGGCASGNGGPVSLGLLFAAFVLTRRRRR
jgi:uncharacterized protein (TIGR03382 family)